MGWGSLGRHDEDFEFASYDFLPSAEFLVGRYRPWIDDTARRLTAEGWTVHTIEPTGPIVVSTGEMEETGRTLYASRDGLILEVGTENGVYPSSAGGFVSWAELNREPPWWLTATGAAAWLLGGLLSWLTCTWANRRTRTASGTARVVAVSALPAALLFLVPLSATGAVAFMAELFRTHPFPQPFWGLSSTYGWGCAVLGLFLLLVALVATLTAGSGRPRSGT
ncbi:hypothetical protein [Actinoplanes sp. NPDC023714]|uniref:hypothetical protein n=1 Tax=Actinoplanes sp. NPDC023714 TaxID=3154322 RepID=UPI0033DA8EA1